MQATYSRLWRKTLWMDRIMGEGDLTKAAPQTAEKPSLAILSYEPHVFCHEGDLASGQEAPESFNRRQGLTGSTMARRS